ncbi:hypothetical protein ACFQPG_09145 [Sphingomonas sp. GCM10030256]|uniref:hypothetical protein n=1 Tax=Sphingomonas sp. GCM10030256 TaxID=3273427 RepID=UPI00360CD5B0
MQTAAIIGSEEKGTRGTAAAVRAHWPLGVFAGALLLGWMARVMAGWSLPLWFDEAFTGTIAGQPNLSSLLRWCLTELTGPAFYMPMWAWAQLAGTSDAALRAPALLLSLAAPLVIAWRGHRSRDVRLFWAALLLLWLPALPTATEARPYPQIIFLACLQAMTFLRAARLGEHKWVAAWAAITALAALTHYYSLPLVGCQGLVLLFVHRRSLLRLWPAALPFLLMAAWMAFHLPFVIGFTATRASVYSGLTPDALLTLPMWLFGVGMQGYLVAALVALTLPHWLRAAAPRSPEALLVWTGIAGVVLLVAAGLAGASMMPRYIASCVPALLFGVACWAQIMRSRLPLLPVFAFAALIAAMGWEVLAGPSDPRFRERRWFEFETASAWMAERSPQRMVFLWSTPTGAQSAKDNLADVAGFFLRRSGKPVSVTVIDGGRSPSLAALNAAQGDPGTAILWVSDDPVKAGMQPRIVEMDASWQCRDFGGERILVHACRRP